MLYYTLSEIVILNINLGVAVARRDWAEKDDIINTYPIKKLEKLFEK